MKIVIATDSHKGCMSSEAAGNIIASAVRSEIPSADISVIPVSDGGEGTVDALVSALGGELRYLTVKNPVGNKITARYGISGTTAVMEMAEASGLTLLKKEEMNPMFTSTYGTGEMILDAIESGCAEIIIGIGGSATNDGGAGMAQALGVKFFGSDGNELEMCGGNLSLIEKIDISSVTPKLKNVNVRVACDVKNPLFGENGASRVFAKQKGADSGMIEALDSGLRHYAEIVKRDTGADVGEIEGGGAAGGLGAGLVAFCSGRLEPGFSIVSDILALEEKIRESGLVITGEGKTDSQTVFGKLPAGIGETAKKYGVPCVIVSGCVSGDVSVLYDHGITAVFSSLTDIDTKLPEALADARENLKRCARNMIRLYFNASPMNRKNKFKQSEFDIKNP